MSRSQETDALTPEQIASLALSTEELLALLPEDEQRAYRECQQSVIDARRHGERIARELWIG